MTHPVRIQLSRAKGFNLQAHSMAINGLLAVKVDRTTMWGNPLRVGMWRGYSANNAVYDFRKWLQRDLTVRTFENCFGRPPTTEEIRQALRGHNLACWCKPGEVCHADVLLEIANR